MTTLSPVLRIITRGGPGSGNFGHEGRPGEVGGSISGGGKADGIEKAIAAEGQAVPIETAGKGKSPHWMLKDGTVVAVDSHWDSAVRAAKAAGLKETDAERILDTGILRLNIQSDTFNLEAHSALTDKQRTAVRDWLAAHPDGDVTWEMGKDKYGNRTDLRKIGVIERGVLANQIQHFDKRPARGFHTLKPLIWPVKPSPNVNYDEADDVADEVATKHPKKQRAGSAEGEVPMEEMTPRSLFDRIIKAVYRAFGLEQEAEPESVITVADVLANMGASFTARSLGLQPPPVMGYGARPQEVQTTTDLDGRHWRMIGDLDLRFGVTDGREIFNWLKDKYGLYEGVPDGDAWLAPDGQALRVPATPGGYELAAAEAISAIGRFIPDKSGSDELMALGFILLRGTYKLRSIRWNHTLEPTEEQKRAMVAFAAGVPDDEGVSWADRTYIGDSEEHGTGKLGLLEALNLKSIIERLNAGPTHKPGPPDIGVGGGSTLSDAYRPTWYDDPEKPLPMLTDAEARELADKGQVTIGPMRRVIRKGQRYGIINRASALDIMHSANDFRAGLATKHELAFFDDTINNIQKHKSLSEHDVQKLEDWQRPIWSKLCKLFALREIGLPNNDPNLAYPKLDLLGKPVTRGGPGTAPNNGETPPAPPELRKGEID